MVYARGLRDTFLHESRGLALEIIVVILHQVAPAYGDEAVMGVVPRLIHAHRNHRDGVVRYRTGNEIVARVAGRIARGIRQRDILEDILRNRALPRGRYHAPRKQGAISIGRDAERIVHLNRETLAGLRGEGLGKIAAAF